MLIQLPKEHNKISSRTEENKQENLLQKIHIGKSINQTDRKILPCLSLSQTIIKLLEYNSQSMGLGHILLIGIQNNLGDQILADNYKIQPS
jgi:5,10-methylene-tetrahydrofolate dehydrogenase/methenyl tetrahydrofolate cyclohydrolase